MLRISAGGLMLLAIAFSARGAQGQTNSDRATARALALDGHQALEERDFTKAEDLLGRAYSLVPAPTVGVELARAQVALGKLVAAHETYSRVLHEEVPASASPAQRRSISDARKELDRLKPRLPRVVIVLTGSEGATVTVDNVTVSRATLGVARFLDPGAHTVQAAAAGFAAETEEVSLKEGEVKRIDLKLVPLPAVVVGAAVAATPSGSGASTASAAALIPSAEHGPSSPAGSEDTAVASSRAADADWSVVGDTAGAFGLGALGFGVTAWIDARRIDHGNTATQPERDAHSRTNMLAIGGLATGAALTIGGVALRLKADGDGALLKEVGWGLIGVGASGVGFGVVTGLMGRHVQTHLDGVCRPTCPAVERPNVDNQNTLGTWSVVGFVGGGLAAASGVALVLVAHRDPAKTAAAGSTKPRSDSVPYVVLPYVDVASNAFGLTAAF
jgi:PEGA domain